MCIRDSFNFDGIKAPAYCKQHAEDGMVDVRSKRCLHQSCVRHPSFNFDGIKAPAYCKQHAEDGMVNVRTRHSLLDNCINGPAQIFAVTIAPTARTGDKDSIVSVSAQNSDSSSDVAKCRKRSRWNADEKQSVQFLDHDTSQARVADSMGMGSSKTVIPKSSSRAFDRYLNNDTAITNAELTGQVFPHTMTPFPNEHCSGEPVKTEIKLDVLF